MIYSEQIFFFKHRECVTVLTNHFSWYLSLWNKILHPFYRLLQETWQKCGLVLQNDVNVLLGCQGYNGAQGVTSCKYCSCQQYNIKTTVPTSYIHLNMANMENSIHPITVTDAYIHPSSHNQEKNSLNIFVLLQMVLQITKYNRYFRVWCQKIKKLQNWRQHHKSKITTRTWSIV